MLISSAEIFSSGISVVWQRANGTAARHQPREAAACAHSGIWLRTGAGQEPSLQERAAGIAASVPTPALLPCPPLRGSCGSHASAAARPPAQHRLPSPSWDAAARDALLQEPPPGGTGGQRRFSTLAGAQRGRFNLQGLQWGGAWGRLEATSPCSIWEGRYVPVRNGQGTDEGTSPSSAGAAGSRCQTASWSRRLRAAQPQAAQPPVTGLFLNAGWMLQTSGLASARQSSGPAQQRI